MRWSFLKCKSNGAPGRTLSLVREIVGFTFHVPSSDGVPQTAASASHRVHVFGEVEHVRADAADLAQVRERHTGKSFRNR
jgi:hypothetical protein